MEEKQYKQIVRNDILDEILTLLMFYETPDFNEISDITYSSKINMDVIADMMPLYEWEDYMKKSFEKELLNKGYIVKDNNGNLSITELGNEFKRKGGYKSATKKENQENTIRVKTIESFKYARWGFYLALIGGFVGFVIANWKDILITLQIVDK